ncbi:9675_t:CDS:1 [Dentiscutata heterogama]|uniref:9675_t:CDS:1 n=1 Tax=Dentiscutata heterogama TaxID=1316150 RepID=A0ACA9M067_9GLOM|nr:9675_t:CDS:1 [Dentiscutata heterogama]
MDRPNRRQQLNKLRQKEILDELRKKRNKLNEKRHIEPEQGDGKRDATKECSTSIESTNNVLGPVDTINFTGSSNVNKKKCVILPKSDDKIQHPSNCKRKTEDRYDDVNVGSSGNGSSTFTNSTGFLNAVKKKRTVSSKSDEKNQYSPNCKMKADKHRNDTDVRIFSKKPKKVPDKHCKGEPESLSDKACHVLPVKEKGKGTTNLIRHSQEIVESMNCREARFYTKYFTDDHDGISEISLMYPGWEGFESFALATLSQNKDKDNEYLPMKDLKSTVNLIIDHVLADDIAEIFKTTLNQKSVQFEINNSIKNRLLDELQDGIQRYNKMIMDIRKNSSKLWPKYITERNTAEPQYIQIVNHVIGQTYDRIIGPRVERLTNITSNLDLNYGELNADFIHDIILRTKIKSNTIFVDLGSGIGNTILYASIATGCMGYGYELRQKLVDLANEQYEEIMTRGKLYGLEIGRVEFLSGDFRDIYINHPNFINILYSADVILANNRTFSPETNQFLYNLFLGLKKGAKVVSLESFEGFEPRGKQSERVFSNIKQFRYKENWVSWTHSDGKFYIATHV